MFGLQRAVIFLDNEFGYVAHHLGVACHLVFIGKTLVEDEVVVALESVTIDAGIVVAVVGNKFL